MEAVAALGVAAASVQFLDFALQALALCRQIRDDAQGATATNKELESYSRSLKDLPKELKSGQADNACGRRNKAVAQAFIAKTEELLILLEKVRKAGSNSRTAAAKTLFRSLKERREIEKLQNELKEKQALLDSALIQDIQCRFDLGTVKQDENFTSLKQSVQALVNRLQDQNAVAQQNQDKTQDKLTNLARESQELRATTGFDTLKISDAKEQLLRSLFYPEHAARREMVRPPWSDTFDWVFDETLESTTYWSSFPAWLKSGSSLYWITGKPASGKSTLMAHILHDRRTGKYLQRRSGGARLHILSFFFWRPGSGLQKSICGLLRSLVMQIADEVPEVAPAILGGLHLPPGRMPAWSERRLTDALRMALTAAKDVYLCFLLDGLDEFDGPYGELVDLIFEMKDSKNVKFCVSSRREAGLANRVCRFDHLSMEDLNYDAIRTFAREKLFPVTDGKALSQEIARRSQGVFLWAVLTTQSLIHGALDFSEDVDMLHRRLYSTPDERTKLFGQILASVDGIHKEQLYTWIRLLSLKVRPTIAELAVMQMPDCVTSYDGLSVACEQIEKHIKYFSKGLLCVYMEPGAEKIYELWHAPEMTRGSGVISSERLNRRKTRIVASRKFGEADQAMKTVYDASCSNIEFLHRSVLDFAANDSVRSVLGLGNLLRDVDIVTRYFQTCLELIAVGPRGKWDVMSESWVEWLMLRTPSGSREAQKNGPLLLATATELWFDYKFYVQRSLNEILRHDDMLLMMLMVKVLSIWDVAIGVELLSSPFHRLLLFVSPSAFLSPLDSMYLGWRNPVSDDANDLCSYEVPKAIAAGVFKRWVDEGIIWRDPQYEQWDEGPSSRDVSDQDLDALVEDVWASETIGSWQQLYLLALLRKWQRQRGREGGQASTDQSPDGSEISHESDSPQLSSEDGER
ncbi:hypothetical protein KC357_g3797 [Hortaea werneckii]|nr:hypothetical protein KC357_g3797 [Hortaea werneckii]